MSSSRQRQVPSSLQYNPYTMTQCGKGGVRIHDSNNAPSQTPFGEWRSEYGQYTSSSSSSSSSSAAHSRAEGGGGSKIAMERKQYVEIDLNLAHYTHEDLFRLFGMATSATLTADTLKECKRWVLMSHPDKSHLPQEYFDFFTKAYAKLEAIAEFQRSTGRSADASRREREDFVEREKQTLVSRAMDGMEKRGGSFNQWFNEAFDKHRVDDPTDKGYEDWLRSDQDVFTGPSGGSKEEMARNMERHKKQVQSMVVYSGVQEWCSAPGTSASALMPASDAFRSPFGSNETAYTDLKQAYTESVIPVTEEDFRRRPQFRSVEEYQQHRSAQTLTPMEKEAAKRELMLREEKEKEASAAVAHYYAQQTEKSQAKQNEFWATLKTLTNW